MLRSARRGVATCTSPRPSVVEEGCVCSLAHLLAILECSLGWAAQYSLAVRSDHVSVVPSDPAHNLRRINRTRAHPIWGLLNPRASWPTKGSGNTRRRQRLSHEGVGVHIGVLLNPLVICTKGRRSSTACSTARTTRRQRRPGCKTLPCHKFSLPSQQKH